MRVYNRLSRCCLARFSMCNADRSTTWSAKAELMGNTRFLAARHANTHRQYATVSNLVNEKTQANGCLTGAVRPARTGFTAGSSSDDERKRPLSGPPIACATRRPPSDVLTLDICHLQSASCYLTCASCARCGLCGCLYSGFLGSRAAVRRRRPEGRLLNC
jgi:hypothetical protein